MPARRIRRTRHRTRLHTGRIEATTGLRRERFLDEFTTPITAEDVAQAPPEHRARLQAVADSGRLVCGYINQASLTETSTSDGFAPAAPFVGAPTGARAAAITVAWLASTTCQAGCDGSTTS